MLASPIVMEIGCPKVRVAPVLGSSTTTLQSVFTARPAPASMELGTPAEITTSPALGNAPEGTLTVQVAPFAEPATVPPELPTVCAVTIDVNPAAIASAGGDVGPYPEPAANAAEAVSVNPTTEPAPISTLREIVLFTARLPLARVRLRLKAPTVFLVSGEGDDVKFEEIACSRLEKRHPEENRNHLTYS